jgi:hypothetical protein
LLKFDTARTAGGSIGGEKEEAIGVAGSLLARKADLLFVAQRVEEGQVGGGFGTGGAVADFEVEQVFGIVGTVFRR